MLTKHRVSAFAGSGLDIVLRSLGTTHLVLTGISTSTVVLMTAMTAADLDFDITVLSDGCFDSRPRVHDMLMSDVFPAARGSKPTPLHCARSWHAAPPTA